MSDAADDFEPEHQPPATSPAAKGDVSMLARGGVLNLFGAVVSAVGTFALYIVLTKQLDKGTTGAFIESIAIFNILAITGVLGADTGLVWAISRSLAKRRNHDLPRFVMVAVIPVIVLGAVFATAIWFGAEQLAITFGDAEQKDTITTILRVMAPVVPLASLFLAVLGATRGFSTMLPTVALYRVGRAAIQPITVAIVLAMGGSIGVLAVGWSLPYAVGLVLGVVWLHRLMRQRTRNIVGEVAEARPAKLLAYRFWRFTAPRSIASIFRVGVQWIDVLIVGAVMSPADAATYGVATRLLQFGLFVASSVGQVAQPMFAGLLAGGEKGRARDVYQTATGWQVAITWPQYIVAAFFASLLLRVIFETEYAEGATVVAILAISTMIGAAAGPVDMLLLMAGKSTWSLWNTGATLGINIGLNLVLIPEYGLVGAAVSWAVSRLVANALPLAQVAGYLQLHPFGRGTLLAAAGATVIYGGIGVTAWLIDDQHLGLFLAYAAVATGTYVLFLHRFRHALELPLAWQAFRRRRGRNRSHTTTETA